MAPLDWARLYQQRGWCVLPVPFREKNPGFKDWQKLRLTQAELPHRFNGRPQNVGVQMGEPSGGLTDVDIDAPEALAVAAAFLKPTDATFGRRSKPESHWLMVARPALPKTLQFKDPLHKSGGSDDKEMLLELRSTGGQTVMPGSEHPSGERIVWHVQGEPLVIDADDLVHDAGRVAAAALLMRYWPGEGGRHHVALALAGALIDASWSKEEAEHFIRTVAAAAGDSEVEDRVAAVATTIARKDANEPYTSWNALAKLTDRKLVSTVAEWLGTTTHVRAAPGDRTTVVIDADEHRVVCETLAAMQNDSTLYQRGGALVTIRRDMAPKDGIDRPLGAAIIHRVQPANLRERLTKHVSFLKVDSKRQLVPAHPTNWLVNALDQRVEYPGIRYLTGISDVPILRPDGSVWQKPGYDEVTGVVFDPPPGAIFGEISPEANIDDAQAAWERLSEVVCDFRFESEAHRSAWLAGLLSPLARFAFSGPSPLFLIDANVRGAGKGLLVQAASRVIFGRDMPVSGYAHDAAEMGKKITSIALAGDQVVLLDNIDGAFGNDALDRALTSTEWKERRLGKNEMVQAPLIAVWFATGNNVQVAADTSRRVIHCRLDVLSERPEERQGFRHPDLLAWIEANRSELLIGALTILSAYCRAGRPQATLTPFGSFEGWSALVRQAVVWLGLPDPCETRRQLAEQADTSGDALAQLVMAWHQYDPAGEGLVTPVLLERLYGRDFTPGDEASVAMRAAVENLVGCPAGKTPNARQVGNRLRCFRRRVVGNLYLDSNPHEHRRGGAVWRLYSVKEGA